MNRSMKGAAVFLAMLFAAELLAGIVGLLRYDGVMSVGYMLALPLLGLVQCGTMLRRGKPRRLKLFLALQALLLVLPPALYVSFKPVVSYEDAVRLVRDHTHEAGEIADENGKRYMRMTGIANPFIEKGYVISISDQGRIREYIVNPVTGKVAELE
ncbi:hypothetical protein ACFFNY_03955 [Paenibacillus hodogayensis]|uniref:Uncharacterized protein n=1 Tax=Paenibacillus hodogayensis TaxID=279208 RepID=A0ABV5VR15_9BACL